MFVHFRRSPLFALNLIHLFISVLTCFDLFIVFLLWLWHPFSQVEGADFPVSALATQRAATAIAGKKRAPWFPRRPWFITF